MKKIGTKLAFCFIVFLFGCKKQNNTTNPTDSSLSTFDQTSTATQARNPNLCPATNGAYLQDGLLCFSSLETLTATIQDIKVKHYSNTFPLSEYYPSECFENSFDGYISLRSYVQQLRNDWLNTEEANPETDPDNMFMPGIGFRTVLNSKGAVKAGNIIYFFMPDGSHFEIRDGSIGKYNTLVNCKDISSELENVVHCTTAGAEVDMKTGNSTPSLLSSLSCIGWQQKDKTSNYASNRRVKVKIWVWNYGPVGADVDSETENFKKTGSIWTKENATEINNGLSGQIVAGDCFLMGSIGPLMKTLHNKKTVGGHLNIYGGLVRKVESKKLTSSGRARTGNTWSSLLNVSIE
ncbi:MAG: hypothetical protein Q7W45_01595 [Bacteroidota bacterium]|nr:hypothetical protein [Bacteroidota bacterium]MDP3144536.1 hypothetical protein [Bacteroidota bacterium]